MRSNPDPDELCQMYVFGFKICGELFYSIRYYYFNILSANELLENVIKKEDIKMSFLISAAVKIQCRI